MAEEDGVTIPVFECHIAQFDVTSEKKVEGWGVGGGSRGEGRTGEGEEVDRFFVFAFFNMLTNHVTHRPSNRHGYGSQQTEM